MSRRSPDGSWRSLPRHSTGLAPDPAVETGAVIQVFAARAVGWRGLASTLTDLVQWSERKLPGDSEGGPFIDPDAARVRPGDR